MIYRLKCWIPYYEDVESGRKPFEVRKVDRLYKIGDVLKLLEFNQHEGFTTGRECVRMVSYVLSGGQFGIEPGYCVLGLKEITI